MSSRPPQFEGSSLTATVTARPAALASPPAVTARTRRLLGLLLTLASAALLFVAAWLDPSPIGLGTHEQMNMPSCGWITVMDLPCPTCGMTTAFAYAAEGSFVSSFLSQPLGFALAILTAALLWLGLYTSVTGSRLLWIMGRVWGGRLWGRRAGWMFVLVVLGAWAYKMISYKFLFAGWST